MAGAGRAGGGSGRRDALGRHVVRRSGSDGLRRRDTLDCSLRGALINADADGSAEVETIVVPAGIYDLTVPGGDATSGSLNVGSSVEIVGAGPGATIVDAHGLDRVLVVIGGGPVADRTVAISGMTFRGGEPCAEPGGDDGNVGAGGGLLLFGVVDLTDVVVEDNVTCDVGGGISSTGVGASLAMTRTIVQSNTAQFGAGGIASDVSLTMVDSTVSGNLADRSRGGGLRLIGTASIEGSTISGNVATNRGGGIDTGNDATSACCLATVLITNSTISGNVARAWTSGTPQRFPGVAGGIYVGRSSFTLRHVTVTGNIAETHPETGGIGAAGGIATGYTTFLTLENAIVAANTGREDCLFDSDATISFTGSLGCSTSGVTPADLGPLADNGGPTLTHALIAGGPAIDGGDPAHCLAADQRGIARPQGSGCDVGAFELEVAPPGPTPAPSAAPTSEPTAAPTQPPLPTPIPSPTAAPTQIPLPTPMPSGPPPSGPPSGPPPPSVTVADVSVVEGNVSIVSATLQVELSRVTDTTVFVSVATADEPRSRATTTRGSSRRSSRSRRARPARA